MASAALARDCEFNQLFSRLPCRASERIIDAPAGGAYLQDFLHRSNPGKQPQFVNLEFTPGFSQRPSIVDPYGDWPVELGWADRAICLAASHHIVNLQALLDNFFRYTRPGGLIQLADVEPGSGIARFLDGFVDAYTPSGHRGLYRSFHDFAWPAWMTVLSVERRLCPWWFDSESQMLHFCMNLFGLDAAALAGLRDALDRDVGIVSHGDAVALQWQLVYVDARRH